VDGSRDFIGETDWDKERYLVSWLDDARTCDCQEPMAKNSKRRRALQ